LLWKVTANGRCDYHDLFASLVEPGDCVASFNYDCIIDCSLRDNAFTKWDPDKKAYGFELAGGSSLYKDHSFGKPEEESIKLFKLHGSTNWSINGDNGASIELISSPMVAKKLSKSLIPPTWLKDLPYPFNHIWKQCKECIREAKIFVAAGYSVPDADYFSKVLLRSEPSECKFERVVVANPDGTARRRLLGLIRDRCGSTTEIAELSSMKELDMYLRAITGYKPQNGRRESIRYNILAYLVGRDRAVYMRDLALYIGGDPASHDGHYAKYSEKELKTELSQMSDERLVSFIIDAEDDKGQSIQMRSPVLGDDFLTYVELSSHGKACFQEGKLYGSAFR
jgi:hypothetical protein